MMNYLQSLTGITLFLTIMTIGVLVSTLIPVLIRWRFDLNPSDSVAKGVFESYRLVVSITLVLFAFSIVRLQGDHRNAEDLVSKEASLIQKLEGQLNLYGGPNADESRGDLNAYTSSIVNDEWLMMAKSSHSVKTSNYLTDLTQGISLLIPKNPVQQMIRVEIGSTLNQLIDVRQARLVVATTRLPSYLWQALILSLMVLTILGWFQSPLPYLVGYVLGVNVAFAALLTLIIQAGALFEGESLITPELISNILR